MTIAIPAEHEIRLEDITVVTTAPQILTAEQKHAERLQGLAGVYQTTDRILTGEGLTVAVEEWAGQGVAAWTDGSKITINSDEISKVDADNIERMHGVNFHELAHILYTPRKGTTLLGWVVDNNMIGAFNILEDQRIETLLTARYPSTVPWISAAIARWVLQGDSGHTGYLFVRGRKYLDGRLRGALRASFIEPSLLPSIDQIIDEYRLLVFPNDYDQARDLITRFKVILDAVNASPNFPTSGGAGTCPNGHGERPTEVLTNGRQRSVTEQRVARDRADDGKPEVEPTPSQDSESDDSENTAGMLDQPDDSSEQDDNGAPTSGPSSDEADDDAQGNPGPASSSAGEGDPAESDGVESHGRAAGNGDGVDLDYVKAIAEQVLAEIRDSEEVRKDISRTQRQVLGAGGSDLINRSSWTPYSPMSEYSTLFGTLRRSLERLVRKADPGWETRNSTGRVNVQRWAAEKNIDTAFDLWDEGVHDAVDMEVVIMLDESGSMNNVSMQASNAMWVVKRALDHINASTTVISFDSNSRVLYHRNDKADARVRYSFTGGGTCPSEGLAQAARIFGRTKKTQKILIVFTDGEWEPRRAEDGLYSEEYIERFNKAGVTTALGYIADPQWMDQHVGSQRINNHGCRIASTVSGEGLVRFISTIVTETISKRLVGR